MTTNLTLKEEFISNITQKTLSSADLIAIKNPALSRLAKAVENRNLEPTNTGEYSRMHNRHNRG
jgi:hypothetical protein